MKKFLKILGIIVGVIVVIIVIAMIFTSGLTKATNSLFSDIKAGNIQAAYTQTAQEFQTSTTLDQFKTFLQQSNLANIKNTTRNERSVTNNQGKLVGSAITTDGGTIHLEINLIKESGKWRIYNILLPKTGVTDQTTTPTTGTLGEIPTQAETTTMVNSAMGLFADALLQGNFDAFYSNIAQVWKQQTTAADLKGIFQKFVDSKIDLSFTKTAAPTFAAVPTMDENGILTVQGIFPVGTGGVVFENKFFKENNAWKLFGINIQIK